MNKEYIMSSRTLVVGNHNFLGIKVVEQSEHSATVTHFRIGRHGGDDARSTLPAYE